MAWPDDRCGGSDPSHHGGKTAHMEVPSIIFFFGDLARGSVR